MTDMDYIYAVARIRALEVSLLSASALEQLLACDSYEDCLTFLRERGWGDSREEQGQDAMLKQEREKTWETIRRMVPDMSPFAVLSYQNLFHNLKAAIKEVCTEEINKPIFYEEGPISREEMLDIVKNKEFSRLPGFMQEAAGEAYEALLHARDGQLCDVILDRAALDAIIAAGQRSRTEVIRRYAETLVAMTDIKIAARCQRTQKSREFMKRALAECESLDVEALIGASLRSFDALCEYLDAAGFKDAVKMLRVSFSAFECWCDNRVLEAVRPEKYHAFSIGPLVAYILARENEIKTVRMILTGRRHGFPERTIRERIREMYV